MVLDCKETDVTMLVDYDGLYYAGLDRTTMYGDSCILFHPDYELGRQGLCMTSDESPFGPYCYSKRYRRELCRIPLHDDVHGPWFELLPNRTGQFSEVPLINRRGKVVFYVRPSKRILEDTCLQITVFGNKKVLKQIDVKYNITLEM